MAKAQALIVACTTTPSCRLLLPGEITSANGERVFGGDGRLDEIAAAERHEVFARSDARLLLLLTPWPGVGHPGAMTLP